MRVKNIMNCLLHLFLFQSIGSELLFDVIRFLLQSFTESDIEVLIFVLHNIGLQLRKKDPASIKSILDIFNQKKNSFMAQQRLENKVSETQTPMDQKLKFLVLELQDIKNNKGSVTMQVRSIEHLQTWLKRDPKLSSELLIKPLDVTLPQIQKSLENQAKETVWWKSKDESGEHQDGEDGDEHQD